MKNRILYQETKYGFDWGACSVQRTVSVDDGSVIISLDTPKEQVYIRVTRTGLIRIEPIRKHIKIKGK